MAGTAAFGALLRGRRQSAGLTLEELAEASGVSARAISDMERGRSRAPQRRTVQALANALALSGEDQDVFLAAARAGRQPEVSGGQCALPRPVPDFSGRVAELSWLTRVAETPVAAEGAAPVLMVSGPAGLGKTTLAVQAAHLWRDQFADGVFFVDLRGMDASPLEPAEALMRLLTALGISAAGLPPDEADSAGLYRKLLGERRSLVVLDNAAGEAQVRPLLPGVGQSVTLVTSRRSLAGLEGVHRLNLTPSTARRRTRWRNCWSWDCCRMVRRIATASMTWSGSSPASGWPRRRQPPRRRRRRPG
jgi:transcriptional regulator with XRE-family HTH domain